MTSVAFLLMFQTIEIFADALYNGELTPPSFPRAVFVELMQMASSSVEFSFNNIMYRHTDGAAMGSPLGPSLANIFVGYYEALLFKRVNKPRTYYRYVDDWGKQLCAISLQGPLS